MNEEQNIKIKVSDIPAEGTCPELVEGKFPEENPRENSKNILEKIAKTCLYFLVFLTPFFFLPLTIAPLEINKQFLAVVLVSIAFLCYLICSINARRIVYPGSWLSLAVLVFLVIAGLSTFFSQVRWVSVFGGFIQPDTFLAFLIYGLVFFLTAVFFKREDLTRVALCFFASLVVTTIFGLFQIFGKFILPWSFTQQTNFSPIGSVFGWGVFITFGLVMIIATLTNLKPAKVSKIFLWLAGFLIMAALIILNYPLLWIGLGLTMLIITIYGFIAKANITLPLVIVIMCLFFVMVNQQLPSLVTISSEIRPNLSSTLAIAKNVLSGKHLLLGSGPATFSYSYNRFRPLALNQTTFWTIRFNQGFSFLSTLVSTLGVLGILSFLLLLYYFIRRCFKALKDEKLLIVLAGLSFLLIILFVYPASYVHLLYFFFGLGILVVGADKFYEMEFYSGNRWRNVGGFIVFLSVILLLSFSLFGLYLVAQKYTAAIYYAKGLSSASADQSANYLDRATRLDPQSDGYWRALSQVLLFKANELMKTIAASQQKDFQNIQTQALNVIAGAINAARQALKINPEDSLNWSNLGNIYENIIPTKEADTMAEQNYNKAIELDPKNPQGPVDLARMWLVSADQDQVKGDSWQEKIQKVKTALEKSINLKSDYAPAHYLMAQVYIREGNLPEAIKKVAELEAMSPNDAGWAFQLGILYYQNKQMEQAQSEFEKAVALNENYSNARYFLGLIYDQKGRKLEAIDQFEKIEKLNPDNQEIKKILDNLQAGRSALQSIVPPAQPPEKRTETPLPEKKKQ